MKKIGLILVALALAACSKVPAGNVGVKYYLLGGSKGVDMETLSPGRYWIGVNEELYLFPTFTQTYVWTKEPIDGDNTDESLSFQDKEGLQINADIGVTYSVDPSKVPELFQKYRKGIDEITDVYLRNNVRDALMRAASNRDAEDMYGTGKDSFLLEVEHKVREDVAPIGIRIEKLYSTGAFRLPQQVAQSINAKIQATQIAQTKENEKAQAEADAEKARAVARGEKDAAILVAEGKAKAIEIEGKALRENANVTELRAIERWNGQLPTFMGGGNAVPFVQVPTK